VQISPRTPGSCSISILLANPPNGSLRGQRPQPRCSGAPQFRPYRLVLPPETGAYLRFFYAQRLCQQYRMWARARLWRGSLIDFCRVSRWLDNQALPRGLDHLSRYCLKVIDLQHLIMSALRSESVHLARAPAPSVDPRRRSSAAAPGYHGGHGAWASQLAERAGETSPC
jgi:hypothetical protein